MRALVVSVAVLAAIPAVYGEPEELLVPGKGVIGEARLLAKRINTPPQIDGKLDEDCWTKGWGKRLEFRPVPVENFHALNNSNAEIAKTVALVCYDDEALYVGWKCYEKGLKPDSNLVTDPE